MKIVPKEKIICDLGSYGYDWITALPAPVRKGQKPPKPGSEKVLNTVVLNTQDAWQAAADSESDVELDDDSMNPHFVYDDEDAKERHQVWFLDAVTVLNEMRAA